MQIKKLIPQSLLVSSLCLTIGLIGFFTCLEVLAANQCVEIYQTNSFLRSVVPFHDEMAVNSDYYKRLDANVWQDLVSNLNSAHRKLEQQVITQGLAEMGIDAHQVGPIKIISGQELDLIISKSAMPPSLPQSSSEKRIYFIDGALDSLMPIQRAQLLDKLRGHLGENAILVISSHVHAIKKEDVAIDLKYYRQSKFMDFFEKPLFEMGIRQYGEVEVHWDDIAHSYQVRFTLTQNIPQQLNALKLMVGDSIILFQSHYFDREKTQHIYRQTGFKNFRVVHASHSRIAFIFAETTARP